MPLFEFVCTKCNAKNEILVRGDSQPRCPQCGSAQLTKQASAFAPMGGSASETRGPAPCCDASCRQSGACPLR